MATKTLRAPFQYFGGKAKVAPLVWRRFGRVANFVEPFAGSLAVLLGRPSPWTGTETVNDMDGYLANFWRAVQAEPEAVAELADWPVNELDLYARHLWLVNAAREQVERLRAEPDFYDVKIAGWWVWGICCWIGSGWCHHPEWQQLPHLGDAGRGVHRPSQQLPHLGDAGREEGEPIGECQRRRDELTAYFRLLSDRLRGVRVCCGNWSRVCGETPTVKLGTTAVFLDPPYSHAERDDNLYAQDHDCAADVREWCLERGDDKLLRIALCGYAGEGHEVLEAKGWRVVEWKAKGGYASQGDTDGANAQRERIWFSPACIVPDTDRTLFDGQPAD